MVTCFNKKDLVDFGNYLLSEERKKEFEQHPEFGFGSVEDRLKQVHHADVENFLSLKNKPKKAIDIKKYTQEQLEDIKQKIKKQFTV